jgi:hypothetical protein
VSCRQPAGGRLGSTDGASDGAEGSTLGAADGAIDGLGLGEAAAMQPVIVTPTASTATSGERLPIAV